MNEGDSEKCALRKAEEEGCEQGSTAVQERRSVASRNGVDTL